MAFFVVAPDVFGRCPDAHAAWFLVLGSWFLVLGSWFLVLGSWFWFVRRGSCVMRHASSTQR
ncbi:hypothetical protein EIQ00_06705 [Xanthomonas campestris pv. raphani]